MKLGPGVGMMLALLKEVALVVVIVGIVELLAWALGVN